ncbi:hypothetical protein EXIGLDRAFT_784167 [Exidia glandulosa HHB12029]|uniref:Uncharacterized protein n=1 Tax=Exidia glandulosa HHB12029 TaxID=1314781 RepID=A0A166MMS7_EXIGL|nr:hypothetical protein EXIGLDRAFT_784167 [Exidia glandulosa HHB12029]
MLKRGSGADRLSSLDVSIELSISSPRVQQQYAAVSTLALLCLLPQGVIDTDIRHFALEGGIVAASVSCLLRTSLAYRTADGRLRVLAPIRDFMLLHHPPTEADASGLYKHYFSLAELLVNEKTGQSSPQAIAAVSPEVENIHSVIHYALDHLSDPRPAVQAAHGMSALFADTGVGSFGLLQHAVRTAREHALEDLVAELLYSWGRLAFISATPGSAQTLWEEARTLFAKSGNHRGTIDNPARRPGGL